MPKPLSPVASMHRLSLTALMAALIAAGAFLHIQIGPVPVAFSDFFVCLTGLVLGPRYGAMAVLLYLTAGAIGLPVFSGGRSGLGHMVGPTGGYLFAFPVVAFLSGIGAAVAKRYAPERYIGKEEPLSYTVRIIILALIPSLAGLALLYTCGTFWLVWRLQFSMTQAVSVGVVPFLPLGIPKIVLAVILFRLLRRKNLVSQW